jgi:hypothetical protein
MKWNQPNKGLFSYLPNQRRCFQTLPSSSVAVGNGTVPCSGSIDRVKHEYTVWWTSATNCDAINQTNFCSSRYPAPGFRRQPGCLSFLTSHLVWSLWAATHVRINVSFHIIMDAFTHAPLLPTRPATMGTPSSSLSLLTLDVAGDGGSPNYGTWAPWCPQFYDYIALKFIYIWSHLFQVIRTLNFTVLFPNCFCTLGKMHSIVMWIL